MTARPSAGKRTVDHSPTSGAGISKRAGWLERRRLRYKRHPLVPFEQVEGSLKTGDIILFHKTTRNSMLDKFELDVLSPLLFEENEFRHSGIILRKDDGLFVLECAEEFHSGYTEAAYPTGGKGIRIVPLLPLLEAYRRDNGDPHFGIRFIDKAIPVADIQTALESYGPVDYARMERSVPIYLSRFFLPKPLLRGVFEKHRNHMMCSEFVHSVLNKCGVLKDYPSKLFGPYSIENSRMFEALQLVGYSEIVRFG
ncbi:MAG: hypothetical protein ABI681_04470 [Gemmatimonadales bacterium]